MEILFGILGIALGYSFYAYPFGHSVGAVFASQLIGIALGVFSFGIIIGNAF